MSSTDKIKRVVEVKNTPNMSEMFGHMQEVVTFCPEELFKKFNIPEDIWYSFELKPLRMKDKVQIESIIRNITIKGLLWAKENKFDVTQFGNVAEGSVDDMRGAFIDNLAYLKMLNSFDDKETKYAIIQKYVVGLDNYQDFDGNKIAFKAQEGADYLDMTIWESLPSKVKELIYNRILEISNLTMTDIQNL